MGWADFLPPGVDGRTLTDGNVMGDAMAARHRARSEFLATCEVRPAGASENEFVTAKRHSVDV